MTHRPLLAAAVALLLSACAAPGPVKTAMSAGPAPAGGPEPAAPFQYLYGSGEAAAISVQAYRLLGFVAANESAREGGNSAVLASTATLAAPQWVPCGNKPHAVVFDADETLILNLGIEELAARRPGPFDAAQWDRWEKTGGNAVVAVPGAVEAVAAIRRAGATVVVNSNRDTKNAAATVAALKAAGLGDFVPGQTLFLKGDVAPGSAKDPRRAAIAARFCVVAMAGDQLGDFSDQFNAIALPVARRAAVQTPAIAAMWGTRWFMLPNPIYGPQLKGGYHEVFPANRRWADPEAGK
ncbi:HAD family acid phosphatase [Sphingomonas aracearum]|uniref:Acid phosphatase n=1 Tax=Sphingomonas aracearum TaxID=2283317 RepID=A0A369W2N7_9SPHN|nr:HAD family acid phosphatase [Sphingomonas aracearum]RDE06331.1 acid phosphatase [Sphingomonas aracearum]